jgi:ribosome-binding ATPase YchF (GTP1/OBG family)
VKEYAAKNYPGTPVVVLSAKLEADVAILEEDQAKRQEFLEQYGLKESGLHNLIRSSVDLLDLMPYYTVGKTETRAWPVKRGSTAKQCAGHIHTVMEQKFIKAEVRYFQN